MSTPAQPVQHCPRCSRPVDEVQRTRRQSWYRHGRTWCVTGVREEVR